MKIAYGIAGEGRGHATRAEAVIDHLLQHHKVSIFAGDRAALYFKSKKYQVIPLSCLRIAYQNNSVSGFGTLLFNILRTPLYLYDFAKLVIILLRLKPDILITDFNFLFSYAALLLGIPLIILYNQHIIPKTKYALEKKWFFERKSV